MAAKYDFQAQLEMGRVGEEIALLYLRSWCKEDGWELRDTRRIHRVKFENDGKKMRRSKSPNGTYAYPDFRIKNPKTGEYFFIDVKRKDANKVRENVYLKLDMKIYTEYRSLGSLMGIPVLVLFYADNVDAEHFFVLNTQKPPEPNEIRNWGWTLKETSIEWIASDLKKVPIINN